MRLLRPLRLSVALLSTAAAVAVAAPQAPSAPIFASPGVEWLGRIPVEAGAAGGQVREANGGRYFLMNTQLGISAFDIADPATPVLAGFLPAPHFEAEDIDFGGNLLVVANDPAWTSNRVGGLYVIDLSQLPVMTYAYLNPATGNRFRTSDTYTTPTPYATEYLGGHTVSCVRADCSWVWATGPGGGSDKIYVIDLRTPSAPVLARIFDSPVGGTHDIDLDANGSGWLVGGGGTALYDLTDPVNPTLLMAHDPEELDYVHNSERRGDTLLITEENWLDFQCNAQGRFATASVTGAETGAVPVILDRWTTELGVTKQMGTVLDGDNVKTLTCSAHWFTTRDDGIVAIAWYEQGTRFLDVSNPADIRQVGYFLAPDTASFAATWVSEDIVYTLDGARGMDILRFTGDTGSRTVRAPVLPVLRAQGVPHPVLGYACRLPG